MRDIIDFRKAADDSRAFTIEISQERTLYLKAPDLQICAEWLDALDGAFKKVHQRKPAGKPGEELEIGYHDSVWDEKEQKLKRLLLSILAVTWLHPVILRPTGLKFPWLLTCLLPSLLCGCVMITWKVMPLDRMNTDKILEPFFVCTGLFIASVIVVMLPVDIAILFGVDVEGLHGLSTEGLIAVWQPLYWIATLMSPMITFNTYYNASGYLTPAARLKDVLTFYAMGAGFGIFCGVIFISWMAAVGKDMTFARMTVAYFKAMMNTGWMVVLLICMSHGFVSFPRSVWFGTYQQQKKKIEDKRNRYEAVLEKETEHYQQAYDKAEELRTELPASHPFRALMNGLIKDPFAQAMSKATKKRSSFAVNITEFKLPKTTTPEKKREQDKIHDRLAAVRKNLQVAKVNMEQMEENLVDAQKEIEILQEMSKVEIMRKGLVRSFASVCFALFSAAMLWSETVGLGVYGFSRSTCDNAHSGGRLDRVCQLDLSPIAAVVNAMQRGATYGVLVIVGLPLIYTCFVTYRSLFKTDWKMMAVHQLRWHHNSVPESVCTLTSCVLGLVNPLCYNFTLVVHLRSGSGTDTSDANRPDKELAYFAIYKDMEQVPGMGTAYSQVFPILLLLFTLANAFRCMKWIKFAMEYSGIKKSGMSIAERRVRERAYQADKKHTKKEKKGKSKLMKKGQREDEMYPV